MPKSVAVILALIVLPLLASTGAIAQNKLYQRYVASDTDYYEGHPDQGGKLILDRRGDPVFADGGTIVLTDGVCGDAWCPIYEDGHHLYLWGGDLCPFVNDDKPPVDCTAD